MGIKSRARSGKDGVSNQLSSNKSYSEGKDRSSKKGILRRAMRFFWCRFIGKKTPYGRVYGDPEFFDSGNGFVKAPSGDLIYQGYVKDGKYNGHGILRSRDNSFRYEGEFRDNLPNGKGKEIEVNGTVIEGNWVNGEPSGKVTVHYPNGEIYIGNFKHEMANGRGLKKTPKDKIIKEIEGYWKDGVLTGAGAIRFENGISVEGSFINGLPNPFSEHTVYFDGPFFFKGKLDDEGQPDYGSLYNTENGVEFFTGEFAALHSKGRGTIFYQEMTWVTINPSWVSFSGEIENLFPNGYGELVNEMAHTEYLEAKGLARFIGNFVFGSAIGEHIVVMSREYEENDFRETGTSKIRIDADFNIDSDGFPVRDEETVKYDLLSLEGAESGLKWGEEEAPKLMEILRAFSNEENIIPIDKMDLVVELANSLAETKGRNMLSGGIEKLLRDDEGMNLEFKASIWSNYNSHTGEFIPRGDGKGEQKEKNWKLQDSVIKTIAGFRNAEGGTLLIGVEDKVNKPKGHLATVLGIQSDIEWTKNKDQESYDHALRDAIRDSMNDKLVVLDSNDVIKITYPEFDGNMICRVDVKGIPRGEEGHIWTKTKKMGKDILFVRSADSTEPLVGADATKYIMRRLKKN